jgi:fumarylacetoacetate (FAA) hydrolase family protein
VPSAIEKVIEGLQIGDHDDSNNLKADIAAGWINGLSRKSPASDKADEQSFIIPILSESFWLTAARRVPINCEQCKEPQEYY